MYYNANICITCSAPSTPEPSRWRRRHACMQILSCDIHTHTPARKSSTNFQLYYLLYKLFSNWLGHGHGYEWHSLNMSVIIIKFDVFSKNNM